MDLERGVNNFLEEMPDTNLISGIKLKVNG